jgi:hypothetical protein
LDVERSIPLRSCLKMPVTENSPFPLFDMHLNLHTRACHMLLCLLFTFLVVWSWTCVKCKKFMYWQVIRKSCGYSRKESGSLKTGEEVIS